MRKIPPGHGGKHAGTHSDDAEAMEALQPQVRNAIYDCVAVDKIRGAPSGPCMGLAGRFAFRRKRYLCVRHGRSRSLIHKGADAVGLYERAAPDLYCLKPAGSDEFIQLGAAQAGDTLGVGDGDGDRFHIAVLRRASTDAGGRQLSYGTRKKPTTYRISVRYIQRTQQLCVGLCEGPIGWVRVDLMMKSLEHLSP